MFTVEFKVYHKPVKNSTLSLKEYTIEIISTIEPTLFKFLTIILSKETNQTIDNGRITIITNEDTAIDKILNTLNKISSEIIKETKESGVYPYALLYKGKTYSSNYNFRFYLDSLPQATLKDKLKVAAKRIQELNDEANSLPDAVHLPFGIKIIPNRRYFLQNSPLSISIYTGYLPNLRDYLKSKNIKLKIDIYNVSDVKPLLDTITEVILNYPEFNELYNLKQNQLKETK